VDRYSTSFEDPVSKHVTKVGVTISPAARRRVEELVDDAEAMIQRCVWRSIWTWTQDQTNTVKGDSVEFTIDADEILELFADLRRMDMEEMPRNEPSPGGAE